MLDKLVGKSKNLVEALVETIRKEFNRPEHIRLDVAGSCIEVCLRKLEIAAGLPEGDLSIEGEPMKMASFPFGFRSLRYGVASKTSDSWKEEGRIGYLCGSILEADKPIGDISCLGTLHISKNCPGVYQDNVCTTCGDHSL